LLKVLILVSYSDSKTDLSIKGGAPGDDRAAPRHISSSTG